MTDILRENEISNHNSKWSLIYSYLYPDEI